MTLLNTFKTALRGLTANKLRALLTMLGVMIGVASVIAMLAIGNGARAAVESSFRFLGADNIQIESKKTFEDGQLKEAGKILSYEDGVMLPEAAPLVDRVEMTVQGSAKVRYGGAVLDMGISGLTSDGLRTLFESGQMQPVGWPDGAPLRPEDFMGEGRFFTLEEVLAGEAVCVLGYDTAEDLFGGDAALGEVIWLNRQRCVVIGVLAELESTDPQQRYNTGNNEALLLPISTAIQGLYEEEPSLSMVAHVTDERRMDEAKDGIKRFLRERHGVEQNEEGEYLDDFYLTTKRDILGAQQDAAATFSLLLAAIASISLVVGGIGIMNVMLVSVSERTREIGVRMAIGARQRDVVGQFLLEAILISAGGGLLGVVLGVLSIPLAAEFNGGMALLAPSSIPLALGVSVLTGLAFGLYPAARAARLDPIEALRYE